MNPQDFEIFGIHGFNDTSAGEENIDLVEAPLKRLGFSYNKDTMDYQFYSLVAVRFKKHSAVLRIAEAINNSKAKYIVLLTYSNGANYAMKALKYVSRGNIFVIHCSPALDRNIAFPANILHAWIFYIDSDWIVKIASLLPFHPWGGMGAWGYSGDDPRVENVEYSDIAKSHGGMFKKYVINFFVQDFINRIARFLKEEA